MNLLVDLDGTITEPARGILASVRHALEAVGVPAAQGAVGSWLIGPPLRTMFPKMGVPPDRVEEAIGHYRLRYVEGGGMFECDLIPGIGEALLDLKGRGHRLFVATSKPHVYARMVIGHFDLADLFDAVHGAELDGRNDAKKDVIASILTTHGVAAADCIMIGDTAYDVEGARHHAIPTIGVTWGHGGEKLAEAKPAAIIKQAQQLPGAVADLARQ